MQKNYMPNKDADASNLKEKARGQMHRLQKLGSGMADAKGPMLAIYLQMLLPFRHLCSQYAAMKIAQAAFLVQMIITTTTMTAHVWTTEMGPCEWQCEDNEASKFPKCQSTKSTTDAGQRHQKE